MLGAPPDSGLHAPISMDKFACRRVAAQAAIYQKKTIFLDLAPLGLSGRRERIEVARIDHCCCRIRWELSQIADDAQAQTRDAG